MKYRIVKYNSVYKIQYRKWFLWSYLSYPISSTMGEPYGDSNIWYNYEFNSSGEAESFLEEREKKKQCERYIKPTVILVNEIEYK